MINKKFVKKITESGLRFEDLACISGLSEVDLYKMAAGKWHLNDKAQRTVADILSCEPKEIFEVEGEGKANG